jgi:hypothetical protein
MQALYARRDNLYFAVVKQSYTATSKARFKVHIQTERDLATRREFSIFNDIELQYFSMSFQIFGTT